VIPQGISGKTESVILNKNRSTLAFIALLALVVMSCGLQISPSIGTQVPPSQNPQPMETTFQPQSPSQSGTCPKSDISQIGILRSIDRGATWTSLGEACVKDLNHILPVDLTGFAVNDRIVLYAVDLLSIDKSTPHSLYQMTSLDGVNFNAPRPAYTQTVALVDPYVMPLADGSFRLYVPSGDEGMLTAVSRDGIAFAQVDFTRENGGRMPGGGMPGAILLPDGRVRMFLSSAGGIWSEISSDGLTFTKESGMRIPGPANLITDNPEPIRLMDGSYLMLFQIQPPKQAGRPEWVKDIHLATSTDGYNWASNHAIIGAGGTSCIVEAADGTLYIYYGEPNPSK
jgi:hypothetical protein